MKETNQEWLNDELGKTKCLGTAMQSVLSEETAASKPVKLSSGSAKICRELNLSYVSPIISQRESPRLNGIAYSRENQSTLIKSSPQCTLSTWMRRERVAWGQLKSYLQSQNQNDMSGLEPSGPQPLGECQKQSYFSSPIGETNCSNMLTTLKDSSRLSTQVPTQKLYSTTNQFETRLEEDRISCLPTSIDSTASVKQSSMPMELNIRAMAEEREERDQEREKGRRRTSVNVSMDKQDVVLQRTSVITDMSAKGAEKEDTVNSPVQQRSTKESMYGMRPKYLRYNIWDPNSDFSPSTADWTLTAKALEGPPDSKLNDEAVKETIRNNPHLFEIVTPIKVDIFESYLSSHPNRPFVDSVCRGLREGFWPWAKTPCAGYPLTNDESNPPPLDEKKADFLRAQRDWEVAKGRYSAPFKHELLPGMYCMPIYAVPKPHSSDLRLVNDQSYGKYSLNSMIDHDKVTGYPLDNLVNFGEMLMDLNRKEPAERKVVWKSDVAEAYRILPMHPHWQVKQITRVDDEYHVDRCNAFGASAKCGKPGLPWPNRQCLAQMATPNMII
jgi:hypothetical protein